MLTTAPLIHAHRLLIKDHLGSWSQSRLKLGRELCYTLDRPTQKDKQPSMHSLESKIKLTPICMSLDCGRKPEYLTQWEQTQRFKPRNFLHWPDSANSILLLHCSLFKLNICCSFSVISKHFEMNSVDSKRAKVYKWMWLDFTYPSTTIDLPSSKYYKSN